MVGEPIKLWTVMKDGKLSPEARAQIKAELKACHAPLGAVLAIDPGPKLSAVVWLIDGRPVTYDKVPNVDALRLVQTYDAYPLVVEMVASYGMAVGAEVFDTCVFIGQLCERKIATSKIQLPPFLLRRADVKYHLCGRTSKVNDSVIRQNMIDRFGGKNEAIGTKSKPGCCYGMSKDTWQALALACTANDLFTAKRGGA